jgi:hypothetical protein
MILDGLGVLVLAALSAFGLYLHMLDVFILCGLTTGVFGLLWWINYGDRLCHFLTRNWPRC